MNRQRKQNSLRKPLAHRTINATYDSKRSLIVMLAIIFMVGVHVFVLGGYEGLFGGREASAPVAPVGIAADDIIDVESQDDAGNIQAIRSARVREAYDYPLFSEYYPYDSSAEDELRVQIPLTDERDDKPNDEETLLEKKPAYRYALKNNASQKARIAIIIDDMGMNRKLSHVVVAMDSVPLTLAFLPYAPKLEKLTAPAKAAGHELMIHMPMEPMNSNVPLGSIAIKDGMTADEINGMLDEAYASFDGYAGLNNHMGSRATQNKAAMDVVMRSLDSRGLFYVDSKTISTSIAADAARKQGIAYAERDIFLDHEDTLKFARDALAKVERVALEQGHAIAIGHPKKNTIAALKAWIPTLEARGFEVVPVSDILMQRGADKDYDGAKVARVDTRAKAKAKVQKKEKSAAKFILSAPEVDLSKIESAAGGADVAPSVAAEDLLSAPIGGAGGFDAEDEPETSDDTSDKITGGLYRLFQ